jgi:hypothetical protein
MYATICYIGANTSQISKNLKPRLSSGAGRIYYALELEVILLFGLTELKAQIAWKEEVRFLIPTIALRLNLTFDQGTREEVCSCIL